jgi:hypothetical protein
MLAAVDGVCGENRSAWILGLIERELLDDSTAPGPAAPPVRTSSGLLIGEPSPGVACMCPTCWQRDTTRYGLRHVPICPADAAALEGRTYERHPGAARVLSGAA